MHRIMVSQVIPDVGQILAVAGDEAEHAVRVKRVEGGDRVELTDGAGVVASAVVERSSRPSRGGAGPQLDIRIVARRESAFPGVRPVVEVLSATPKGGRVDEMIDGLSQVGAAGWSPLETARGVVDPREHKLARLERIAREAAKQCGRPWILRIGASTPMERALSHPSDGDKSLVVVADAAGETWDSRAADADSLIRLLVGPEGGWTDDELAAARRAGARITRFGPHTMRIETAAIAACAVIMGHARQIG